MDNFPLRFAKFMPNVTDYNWCQVYSLLQYRAQKDTCSDTSVRQLNSDPVCSSESDRDFSYVVRETAS